MAYNLFQELGVSRPDNSPKLGLEPVSVSCTELRCECENREELQAEQLEVDAIIPLPQPLAQGSEPGSASS